MNKKTDVLKRKIQMRCCRDVEEATPIDDVNCERYLEWLPKAIQCTQCKNIYCIGELTKHNYQTHVFKDKYYYDCPGCNLNVWIREIQIDFSTERDK